MFFPFIITARNLAVGQFYVPAQGNHIGLPLQPQSRSYGEDHEDVADSVLHRFDILYIEPTRFSDAFLLDDAHVFTHTGDNLAECLQSASENQSHPWMNVLMFNLGELFLILRVEVPMADAPACESCLVTYVVQGLLDHLEFILGGLMVGIRRFYLAFEAYPGLHEFPIRSLLLLKLDAQVSHSIFGACKFPSEVIHLPAKTVHICERGSTFCTGQMV